MADTTKCTEPPSECGRRAFEAGVEAFQKGDWKEALTRFQEAQSIKPHPVVDFNLALAEEKNGLLIEAASRLDAILRDPNLPESLRPKVKDARQRVVAKLSTIEVDTSGAETIVAYVNDKKVEGDPPMVQLNPGKHRVRLMADGRVAVKRTVTLSPGENLRLSVNRARDMVVVVPGSGDEPSGGQDKGVEKPSKGLDPIWFYGGIGATAVLGGLSIWSGLNTSSAFDEYERDLPTLSQEEVNRRVDEGHGKETRTNVLVGVTAVAAVATAAVGIFFVDWGGEAKTSVGVGPGGAVVRGAF